MNRAFANRQLLSISIVLVALVAALAAVQYRWSTRVAAADAQREREHLESSSALFATNFNTTVSHAIEFIQNDAWSARKSGQPIHNVPRLLSDVYFLELDDNDARVEKLAANGMFAATDVPSWMPRRCAPFPVSNPPAMVVPVYDVDVSAGPVETGMHILQTIRQNGSRCFVARINDEFVRTELAPQLIRQSFGDSTLRDYDFSIVSRGTTPNVIYGLKLNPDVKKSFFSVMPLSIRRQRPGSPSSGPENRIFVQRFESSVITHGAGASTELFADGIWELQVAHKDMPMEKAFERVRWRNLLLSVAVEALLIAAIVFLTISVRRMQRLAEQKMQFVAAVSHELRTPVSSISMLSKNQADGLVTGPDRVRQYGELIHQESRRLSDMVEQTLRYAGMNSGLRRRQNRTVDIRSIVAEAVEARRVDFQRRNIELEVLLPDNLPPVPGDANLLRTAIDNLLNNAERHAGEGRWVRVSASHGKAENEVIISVEDRGPGIVPEDQAEIFEPFSRGSAAMAAQIPGSGLGLSLVRSAAEAHNGTVTLESEPGRGSTFKVHLPL